MDDATAAVAEGDGDVVLVTSGVAEAVGLAISVPLAEGGTVSVAEAAVGAAGRVLLDPEGGSLGAERGGDRPGGGVLAVAVPAAVLQRGSSARAPA